MNKELILSILPGGIINLERQDIKEPPVKNRQILEEELYSRYKKDYNNFFLYLGFCSSKVQLSESLSYLKSFADLFTKKLALTPDTEALRENIVISIEDDEINDFILKAPYLQGFEYLTKDVFINIWDILTKEYKKEIKQYKGSVENFIKTYSPDIHLVGRVYFHLVENKNEEKPFAFLATYTAGLNKDGSSRHLPLKNALNEYGKDSKKLLCLISTIYTAAKESPLISEFINSGEIFYPLSLTAHEALNILKEIPVYEKSGILCRIPNWWKKKANTLHLNFKIGNNAPKYLGMDGILDFNIEFEIGDTMISVEEAEKLLNQTEGLAFIKGKWIEVNPDKLKETLNVYKNALKLVKEGLTLNEALKLQLSAGKELGISDENEIQISDGDWLNEVYKKLINPETITEIKPEKDFRAVLRPYQQKGLNWLYFMHSLSLGACLADDMGLGKTIQLLAFLSALRKNKEKINASLLIIPASLISNWKSEIDRFMPSIKYFIAHPSHSNLDGSEPAEGFLNAYALVITTYSFTIRLNWIKNYEWNYIILDEAQAIKNPQAKQTKAVKSLKAKNRIIMTGTPVENKLEDLWSLFDFLNHGLLGNVREFAVFLKSIKSDSGCYAKLKKVISPYILRRLKTDKSIISDLPDKIEMKTYAELSKKQVVLYKNLVNELEKMLEIKINGIDRKGLILASLIKFKQLCNHPDQYLGSRSYLEEESGKFLRLREICETIYQKREKVLVFTQFAEITEHLKAFLESLFCRQGLVLHGGVPVKKRKEIINRFQSSDYIPFIVLSLKAGGIGLNLTEASHVIHFDRWWNPAVENQATDRAFRIGQKKNVIVHKFIAKGTIEEKIDRMIEDKKSLTQEVIGSSAESWITDLDNDKLMEMFTLRL